MSSAPIPYSCNFASVAALPPSDVGYKSIPVYVVYLNLQYSMRYVVCMSKTWELFESVVLELAQSHHNLEPKRQDGWAEKGLQSMPTACKGISRSTFLFWPTTRFHITSHSLRLSFEAQTGLARFGWRLLETKGGNFFLKTKQGPQSCCASQPFWLLIMHQIKASYCIPVFLRAQQIETKLLPALVPCFRVKVISLWCHCDWKTGAKWISGKFGCRSDSVC